MNILYPRRYKNAYHLRFSFLLKAPSVILKSWPVVSAPMGYLMAHESFKGIIIVKMLSLTLFETTAFRLGSVPVQKKNAF